MGSVLRVPSSDNEEVIDPVFVIPRNVYFTPAQMSIMIEAGQQPGVPFRVGGQGASRPSRPITKSRITENLALIDKSSFRIIVHESGKFYVTFYYDSIINLSLYIHFGAKEPLSPDEIRPSNTMLHWGPFNLKVGTKVLWSSEDENLYGDVINLPCSGGGTCDAIVILDSSNVNHSPREDEDDSGLSNGKGWNPSVGIGRLLTPQPHHRTRSPENGEYRMTSSQSDAQRTGNYIVRSAAYFFARPPVPLSTTTKDQNSAEVIEDTSGSNVVTSPSTNKKKSRHHSSSKKSEKHSTKTIKINPAYRGVIPTFCALQRVQLNQNGRIYVTEDLFGMDRNPGNNENNGNHGEGNEDDGGLPVDNDSAECVICMTDPKEVAVYPCRHMCMCVTCAEALPSQNNKCPMCRRPALLLLRLKVWNNNDPSKNPNQESDVVASTKSKNSSPNHVSSL